MLTVAQRSSVITAWQNNVCRVSSHSLIRLVRWESISRSWSWCCFDDFRYFSRVSSAVCVFKTSVFAFSFFGLAQFFFNFISGDHHCCQDEYVSLLLGRMSLRLMNMYAWMLVDRETSVWTFSWVYPEIKTWLKTDDFVNSSAWTDTFIAIFTTGNKGSSLFEFPLAPIMVWVSSHLIGQYITRKVTEATSLFSFLAPNRTLTQGKPTICRTSARPIFLLSGLI